MPPGDWAFPLKGRYDRMNFEIEGDQERAEVETTPFLAPPDAPPADPHGEEVHNYAVENIPRSFEDFGAEYDGEELADGLFDDAPADPPDDGEIGRAHV